jgi:hypothetical protein
MESMLANDKTSSSNSAKLGVSGASGYIEVPSTNNAHPIVLPKLRLNGERFPESPNMAQINPIPFPLRLNLNSAKSPEGFFSIDNISKGFFESPMQFLKSPSIFPMAQGYQQSTRDLTTTNEQKEFILKTSSISPPRPKKPKTFFPDNLQARRSLPNGHCFSYYCKKIVNLSGLFNLLVKLFIPSAIIEESDLQLTAVERVLLVNFLQRKNIAIGGVNSNNGQPIDLQLIRDALEKFRLCKSTKRIEERKKFVYKNVLKKLRKNAVKNLEADAETHNISPNEALKRAYFSDYLTSSDLNIEQLIDPLNAANKDRTFKTLSKSFFKIIFKNKKLMNDFFDYLDSPEFTEDYQKRIQKKIEKLLARWEILLRKGSDGSQIMARIREYFTNNKQCKLPWTSNEIRHAIESFKKFMGKIQKQNAAALLKVTE